MVGLVVLHSAIRGNYKQIRSGATALHLRGCVYGARPICAYAWATQDGTLFGERPIISKIWTYPTKLRPARRDTSHPSTLIVAELPAGLTRDGRNSFSDYQQK
jgi:hypothetical protein